MHTRAPLPIHLNSSRCPAASLTNSRAFSLPSSLRQRSTASVFALTSTPTHVLIDCIRSPSCVIKTRASRPCTLTGRPCKCWLSRLRYSSALVKRAGSLSSPRARGSRIPRLSPRLRSSTYKDPLPMCASVAECRGFLAVSAARNDTSHFCRHLLILVSGFWFLVCLSVLHHSP